MKMRVVNRLRTAGAATIAAAAAVLTGSSPAMAQTHSYGRLINTFVSYPDANQGAQININTSQLSVETCSNFVNHEFWYVTYTDTPNYWIEVGFKDGLTGSGGCVNDVDFWADSRPDGSYNEHYPGNNWSFNKWYDAEVQWISSCTWNVILGGVVLGTSTSNCAGTNRQLAAGIEWYQGLGVSEFDEAEGYLTDWREESSSGIWSNGWSGPTYLDSSSPPYIIGLSSTETKESLGPL
jgi:hypothetical protein